MSRFILEQPVIEEKLVKVEVKPILFALRCDNCGKVFRMEPWGNVQGGDFHATFEDQPRDPKTGRTEANSFNADVCSFKCADELYTGGWKKLPQAKLFVKQKCRLARAEVAMTTPFLDERTLRKERDRNRLESRR